MTAPHADRDHNEEPLTTGMFDTFVRPCLDCGTTIRVVSGQEQPHEHRPNRPRRKMVARAWWEGHDASTSKHIVDAEHLRAEVRRYHDRAMSAEAIEDALRAEIADRESERADLRDQLDKAEAEVERLRATGLRHLDYFKAMRASRAEAEARAEAAEAALAEERAKVARVEALADEWERARRACEKRGVGGGPTAVARKNRIMRRVYEGVLADFRAGLAGPAQPADRDGTADAPQQPTQPRTGAGTDGTTPDAGQAASDLIVVVSTEQLARLDEEGE